MTERLIPDPPLGDFPALPDNMRWRIEPPEKNENERFRPLRGVYIEKRTERKTLFGVKMTWERVFSGAWRVKEGLGDFSVLRPDGAEWTRTVGLASVMGYMLKEINERPKVAQHLDVHGVSKV